MKKYLVFLLGLLALATSPASAVEMRGELILNKIPLYEIESPKKLGCTAMFDVKKEEDVPDLRVFRNYLCQGRYEVILRGEPGRTVTVFGQFNYKMDGGFLVLVKNDDKTIWVENLETLPAGKWVDVPGEGMYGGYRAFYQHAPRFSQSISSIKWGQWWSGDTPAP